MRYVKVSKEGIIVKKARGAKKIILILVIGALVVCFGLYCLPKLGVGFEGLHKQPASKNNEQRVKQTYSTKLESFIVNLADNNYRRYLKVTITLNYTETSLEEEIQQKNYQIRDVIIGVLRSKLETDLSTAAQTEQLRKELVSAINKILVQGNINGLYFEDFLIQ